MPDAFGDSFTEKQFGSNLQVFRMLDEPETDNCLLSCPQLVLKRKMGELRSISQADACRRRYRLVTGMVRR